ncbi:hypothetical protein [Mucilaginibacter sp.]|uniref:hypothetical protein n=1 Tax=Mucilaginibacter sp. TaxID=1882438 RepID=UPI002842EDE7|nr:hypothetical protein [Mucilaginibacter sp.]MDR3697723.1 hypothetical protein [Mucilaginibacter sp.]
MRTHLSAKKVHTFKLISLFVLLTIAVIPAKVLAQTAPSVDSAKTQMNIVPQTSLKPTYPKVVGYVSFILPMVTASTSTTFNFNGTTTIGFPIGVNVLYSDKFGFSYEFTPNIKATKGTSKMNDILFDPGTMFRFQHGFTIISRLAFDTNGRYGFTPVFNQVYLRTKDVNYFVAVSLPARFGNSEASSIGLNLQIGFIFN